MSIHARVVAALVVLYALGPAGRAEPRILRFDAIPATVAPPSIVGQTAWETGKPASLRISYTGGQIALVMAELASGDKVPVAAFTRASVTDARHPVRPLASIRYVLEVRGPRGKKARATTVVRVPTPGARFEGHMPTIESFTANGSAHSPLKLPSRGNVTLSFAARYLTSVWIHLKGSRVRLWPRTSSDPSPDGSVHVGMKAHLTGSTTVAAPLGASTYEFEVMSLAGVARAEMTVHAGPGPFPLKLPLAADPTQRPVIDAFSVDQQPAPPVANKLRWPVLVSAHAVRQGGQQTLPSILPTPRVATAVRPALALPALKSTGMQTITGAGTPVRIHIRGHRLAWVRVFWNSNLLVDTPFGGVDGRGEAYVFARGLPGVHTFEFQALNRHGVTSKKVTLNTGKSIGTPTP